MNLIKLRNKYLLFFCTLVFCEIFGNSTIGFSQARPMRQGFTYDTEEKVVETGPNENAAETLTNALMSDSLKFIFTSDRGKRYELWKKVPGYSEKIMESSKYATWGAKVSPDGKKVLFYKGIAKKSNSEFDQVSLWTMDVNGENQQEVLPYRYNDWISHSDANWSFNGAKIVMSVVQYVFEGPQIIIMNADGTKPRVLTERKGGYITPSFSPDGMQIVCAGYPNDIKRPAVTDLEIFIIDLEDGSETRLTYDSYADEHPSWSPDGEWIVFDSSPKSMDMGSVRRGLRKVPANGGDVEDILFDQNWNIRPRWLADSKNIFFERIIYLRTQTQLCTMASDGFRVFPLTSAKQSFIEATIIP
jgi:TolB protein